MIPLLRTPHRSERFEPIRGLDQRAFDDPNQGGNGDGHITAEDRVFSQLRVWVDLNHNGISEPAELKTLESLGISDISVNAERVEETDQYGNRFFLRARFEMRGRGGRTEQRWAYDVYLSGNESTTDVRHSMKQPLRNLTAGFLAVAGSTVTPMAMRSPTHTGWPLSSQVATANKPVALEEVDFIQPPSEMWRFVHNADALARVRINKSRVFMDSHGYVLTEHSATLVEGIKAHQSLGASGNTVTITQRAGQVDLGDRVAKVASDTPLTVGMEYVLFLHWNPSFGSFEIFHGPYGTFKLVNGFVDTRGNGSVVSQSVRGQNQEVFLSDLRSLSTK